MNNEITIILLSHKSKNLVLNFIKDIHIKYKIIIIDNSNDIDLKNIIHKNFPGVLINIIENNGYGSAINYASKLVTTKYFLISNPDISDLNEININKFLDAAKILNDNFSALGPRFVNANPKSLIQSDPKKEIAEMEFISGACMFFRKEKFISLGGFDENFFLYFEESDLCLRASKLNKNYQINTIKVKHYVGTSVSVKNKKEKRELEKLYNWHFIWSKFYYYKKNYGYAYSLFYFLPVILRTILKVIFYSIFKNQEKKENYLIRLDGLISSIKGLSSNKRINK